MGHMKTNKFLSVMLAIMMVLSNSSFITSVAAEPIPDPTQDPTAEVVTEQAPAPESDPEKVEVPGTPSETTTPALSEAPAEQTSAPSETPAATPSAEPTASPSATPSETEAPADKTPEPSVQPTATPSATPESKKDANPVSTPDAEKNDAVVEEDIEVEEEKEPEIAEETSLHVYEAESMAEYTAAVAQLSDDPNVRLLVSTGQDLTTVLNDGKAVYYDRSYIIEFKSEEDRDLAYDIVKDALSEGGSVAKDTEMGLCENDSEQMPVETAPADPADDAANVSGDKETETPATPAVETNEQTVDENKQTEETETKETEEAENAEPASDFDYEITVDQAAVSNAEEGIAVAEASGDDVKVIALIDSGVNGDLADAKVNLTTDGDDDVVGHGTDMADMIKHIAGDKASILSIKAFNDNGTGNISTVNAAVEYAIEADVDIINISAAILDSDKTDVLKATIMRAIQKGIIVVAAAGNNSSDVANYVPANIEGVHTIGAAYADGEVYSCFTATPFSNYGSQIDYWYIADSTSLAAAQESAVLAAGIENEGYMETNRWYRFPWVKFHNGGSNNMNYNPLNGGQYSPFTWVSEEGFGLAYTITGSGNLVTDRDPSSWDGFAYRGSTFTIDGEAVTCIDPDVYSSNDVTYVKEKSCSTSSSSARYWYNHSKYNGDIYHYTVDLVPVPSDPNRYDPTKDTFVYENRGTANLTTDNYYVVVTVENGDKSAINARISGNKLLVDIDENAADMPDGIKIAVRTDKEEIGYTDWITYYESCSSVYSAPGKQRMKPVGGDTSRSWEEEGGSTDTYLYDELTIQLNVLRGGVDFEKFDDGRFLTDHYTDPNRAEGDATLAGAEFAITNVRNNQVVAILTTDSKGKPVTVKNNTPGTGDKVDGDLLKWGDYRVTEIKAPEGYLLNEDWSYYFEVREDKHIYNASDPYDGATGTNGGPVVEEVIRAGMELTKFDTDRHSGHLPGGQGTSDGDVKHNTPQGDATLEGATFDIINVSQDEVLVNDEWYQVNDVVMTLTTDADGYISTDDQALPYGTYKVVETKAPEGYILNEGWQVTFKVSEDGTIYRLNDIENAPYIKSKSEDGTKTGHDYVYDHHNNGVITADFMLDDVIRGGVKFQKIDRERYDLNNERPGNTPQGDATLEGTVIDIINDSDYSVMVYGQWFQPGEVVYQMVTDVEGKCETAPDALPYGRYHAIETQAPVGYLINTAWRYDFVISEDGVIIDSTDVPIKEQVIRGDVRVYKYDLELNRPEAMDGDQHDAGTSNLNDVAFEIYNVGLTSVLIPDGTTGTVRKVEPGELVDTIYSQWDDEIKAYVAETIEDELPYGSYKIQEVPCSISGTNTKKMTDEELETSANNSYMFTDGTPRYFQIGRHSYGPVTLDTDVESVNGLIVDIGSNEDTKNYQTHIDERASGLVTYTVYDTITGAAIEKHHSFWTKNNDSTAAVSNPMSDLQENNGTVLKLSGDAESDKTMIFKNQVKRNELKFDKKRYGDNKPLETLWVLTNVTSNERHIVYANTDGEFRSDLYPHTRKTNDNDKFLELVDNGVQISLANDASNDGLGPVTIDYGIWFGVGEDGTPSEVDDGLAALPYGVYTLDEIRTSTNEGLTLQHVEIRVDQDVTIYESGYDAGTIQDYGVTMKSELLNAETQDHSGVVDGSTIKLVDKVTYTVVTKDELPKEEYVLEGKLINKATGAFLTDADGNVIVSVTRFTMNSDTGTIEQEFEVDTTSLNGAHEVVAYEYLWTAEEWDQKSS